MGAWGSGSFENDAALDWAGSVHSAEDVRGPFERLKALGTAQADADLASEVIAAAETVAMMLGRRSRDFPDELAGRLADAGEPDGDLFHEARGAVLKVMRNSELAELWAEGVEEGGANEWLAEITRLIDRLNPDVEPRPWAPEEIEQKTGPVPQPCAFCGKPVQPDELFMMTIYDATNSVAGERGFWLHLPCLSARMHHKHAIADLKFDPKNMPDLDTL